MLKPPLLQTLSITFDSRTHLQILSILRRPLIDTIQVPQHYRTRQMKNTAIKNNYSDKPARKFLYC